MVETGGAVKPSQQRTLYIPRAKAKYYLDYLLMSGGKLLAEVMVTDVLRNNRGLKPQGVIELNEDGLRLADLVAREVVERINGMVK